MNFSPIDTFEQQPQQPQQQLQHQQPQHQHQQPQQQQDNQLSQPIINQIITGLQQGSKTGATKFPVRDTPINTINLTVDPVATTPQYIPPAPTKYIPIKDDIRDDYYPTTTTSASASAYSLSNMDYIYNEIQYPLLLAILYFIIQMPMSKQFFYNYFPALFSQDGQYNLQGFMFTSSLFGIIAYGLFKLNVFFSQN
jgi:hypothetical protein